MQTDGMTQNEICQEILKQWELCRAAAAEGKSDEAVRTAVDIQIARIMEQQALCVVHQKKASDEQRKLKQNILSQYAEVISTNAEFQRFHRGTNHKLVTQVSDGEGGLDEDDGYDDDVEDRLLSRNTNAEDVMKLEKSKKESLRQESAKKKEKDKEDREKQKQLALDRKEKEKKRTQKGEKKR